MEILHIKGWKETSEGDILDYVLINNKQENLIKNIQIKIFIM